jgi:glutamate/tyrosine decarboxylase-like PLP-dependent enzyme
MSHVWSAKYETEVPTNGPPYRAYLEKIRQSFPQPISNRTHDAYFVISILRALDQVDQMKSEAPLLGRPQPLDYDAARKVRVGDSITTIEDVTRLLVGKLEGLPIWSHPRAQVNVIASPSIPSIIGYLLPSIYNPNLVSDDSSYGVAVAEEEVVAMTASLFGLDSQRSAGWFTFGGTGTVLYGVKIGLEKAIPNAMEIGVGEGAVVIASEQSHYCRLNVAGWLGLGERQVVLIPTNRANEMDIEAFRRTAHQVVASGKRIAAIIATVGTTDAFGLDDLEAIVAVRDELVESFQLDYRPHIHADAVIGWAWSVFNDYPFRDNPLGFRPRTIRALAGVCRRVSKLHLADSIGVDFHKTGFTPYVSSLFLLKNRDDVRYLMRGREEMPYLFQTGERHPGKFTLETSRSGAGVLAAWANLCMFGKLGLRCLLGHLVEMAELLREYLEGHEATSVLNDQNMGTVTLFRVYPDGVDTWTMKDREQHDPEARTLLLQHNAYNRRIFQYLHQQAMRGEGVLISMTDCYRRSDYGEPIVALKSYILSPFVDAHHIQQLVHTLLEAREAVGPICPDT